MVEEARIDAWSVLLPLAQQAFTTVLQYNNLLNKLPRQKIYSIFGDAIDTRSEFASDALRVELIGMNRRLII
jgi:hypothetical protein